jgi:hypothetical protein
VSIFTITVEKNHYKIYIFSHENFGMKIAILLSDRKSEYWGEASGASVEGLAPQNSQS